MMNTLVKTQRKTNLSAICNFWPQLQILLGVGRPSWPGLPDVLCWFRRKCPSCCFQRILVKLFWRVLHAELQLIIILNCRDRVAWGARQTLVPRTLLNFIISNYFNIVVAYVSTSF